MENKNTDGMHLIKNNGQWFTFVYNFQGLSNCFIHCNRVIKSFDSLAIVMSVINAAPLKQNTRNASF